MKYYKNVLGDPNKNKHRPPRSLSRGDKGLFEMRRDGKWVPNNDLGWDISGMGGDGFDYHEISKSEADEIIKRFSL